MKIKLLKKTLLPMLQSITGVVEKKIHDKPILSHLLLEVEKEHLTLTASNIELESKVFERMDVSDTGKLTLPARKILDLCRTLPDNAELTFEENNGKVSVQSGHSRFLLSSFPSEDFPKKNPPVSPTVFSISQQQFLSLLENTQFSMAQQDIRYYLNGLLLDLTEDKVRAVATDGHRLSLDEIKLKAGDVTESTSIIIPRRCVVEMLRILKHDETKMEIQLDKQQIKFVVGNLSLVSQLIDGDFPDYEKVIPDISENVITADREVLQQGLIRAAILSNEKYKGIKLILAKNSLQLLSHNPEQEEAKEQIDVKYQGEDLQIGFNVSYLVEALTAIKTKKVKLSIKDPNSSCLIFSDNDSTCRYVVMPMKI